MSSGRLHFVHHALASYYPLSARSIFTKPTSITIISFLNLNSNRNQASSPPRLSFSSHVCFAPIEMVASWNRNREGSGVGKGVISIRMMGGGPRTFPGGVTKWQWKRMQEKKQKIREKAWLAREKLIYDRRRRAEMMAATPVLEMPWERHSRAPTVLPVDFDPKIKVMADRFQKDGALDLWTDEDGPEQFSTRKNLPQGPHPLGLGLWRTKPELTNGNVLAKEENSFMIQDKRKSNTSTQTERSKRSASESAKSSIPDRQPIPGRKNIQNINGRRQAGTARKTLQSLPLSEKIRNHRNGISGNSKR